MDPKRSARLAARPITRYFDMFLHVNLPECAAALGAAALGLGDIDMADETDEVASNYDVAC